MVKLPINQPDLHLKKIYKLFDKLMVPLMHLLDGFSGDSVQETHTWHVFNIPEDSIPNDYLYISKGDSSTKLSHSKKSLLKSWQFHAPIIGGWKKYIVLGPENHSHKSWHIGWIVYDREKKALKFSQISKLKIRDDAIKLLKSPDKYLTKFFAIDEKGSLLKLIHHGEGTQGDKKFKKYRLF